MATSTVADSNTSSGPTEAQQPNSKVPRYAGEEEAYAMPVVLGQAATLEQGAAPTESATSSSSSPGTAATSGSTSLRSRSDRGAFSRLAAGSTVPPLPEESSEEQEREPADAQAPGPAEQAHCPDPPHLIQRRNWQCVIEPHCLR